MKVTPPSHSLVFPFFSKLFLKGYDQTTGLKEGVEAPAGAPSTTVDDEPVKEVTMER
jgi:hypothetical protein